MTKRGINRRAQLSIFVIIAIIIVGSLATYFIVKSLAKNKISEELAPAYDSYISCMKDITKQGVRLMEEQGGYINLPKFSQGSYYMPFSSQLDFFGQGVPYWLYVSGNNFLREQVPSKSLMEYQLGEYISEHSQDCDFSELEKGGYRVDVGKGKAKVKIGNYGVKVNLDAQITISKGNETKTLDEHSFETKTKLGKFYEQAVKIYDYEKENMFLEKYALDVMRLYAPVTGVELSCSPKIFNDAEIRRNLTEALENNIMSLKVKGGYYNLKDSRNKYFVVDPGFSVSDNVNFLYSRNWPTKIDIHGKKVVTPVGIQQGLGILGFCYVPYHLVYDIDFPVLIQLYDEKEIFQFPVAVIISKNQARKALMSSESMLFEDKICADSHKKIKIETFDEEGNPVEADVRFKCLQSICPLGRTKTNGGKAVLYAEVPECVNGFVIGDAQGYLESKKMVSTNRENSAEVLMKKKYKVKLDLGKVEKAVVYFDSPDYFTSALYPDMKEVELAEGRYNVSVYVYKNSTIYFPAINKKQCVDVPEKGIAGLFGKTREKCIDINIPETQISMAIVGGGHTQEYLTRDELETAKELNINVPLFKEPESLEELQKNQISADEARIYLEFEK